PAARAAGSGLLVGLALAAGVAYCNAVASAQLAAQYPESGGTYVYGRERLGEWWGFLAGWGFVVGKTASCAAMALTFASYAVPGHLWAQRLIALVSVVALTAANLRGISRTAGLARILVALAILALLVVVVAIWAGGHRGVELRRQVGRARRIGLVVDDVQPEGLRITDRRIGRQSGERVALVKHGDFVRGVVRMDPFHRTLQVDRSRTQDLHQIATRCLRPDRVGRAAMGEHDPIVIIRDRRGRAREEGAVRCEEKLGFVLLNDLRVKGVDVPRE